MNFSTTERMRKERLQQVIVPAHSMSMDVQEIN